MGRILQNTFFTFLVIVVIELAAAQAPQAALLPPEQLVTFDWRQAELRRAQTGWQIQAGGVVLKEFAHEADGLEALRLIQELRLTQHGVIGTPQPVLEYWLTDDHAPATLPRERRVIFFDPDSL